MEQISPLAYAILAKIQQYPNTKIITYTNLVVRLKQPYQCVNIRLKSSCNFQQLKAL